MSCQGDTHCPNEGGVVDPGGDVTESYASSTVILPSASASSSDYYCSSATTVESGTSESEEEVKNDQTNIQLTSNQLDEGDYVNQPITDEYYPSTTNGYYPTTTIAASGYPVPPLYPTRTEFYFSDPVTISASNPYAHQLSLMSPQLSSGWVGASSLQLQSAHQAQSQLRQANHTRNRKKRARGFDEKMILSATRIIQCQGVDMAHEVLVEEKQLEETEIKEQVVEIEPQVTGEVDLPSNQPSESTELATSAIATPADIPPASTSTDHSSTTPILTPATSIASTQPDTFSTAPSTTSTDSTLPSDVVPSTWEDESTTLTPPTTTATMRYPTLHELATRPDLIDCPDFIIQHGQYLPELHVKYISDIFACVVNEDGTLGENCTNVALQWLLEDLDQDDDPVIGVDAEGRQIHVLQLATRSRCVLIKMPKYHEDRRHQHAKLDLSYVSKEQTAPPSTQPTPTTTNTVPAAAIPTSTPYSTSSISASIDVDGVADSSTSSCPAVESKQTLTGSIPYLLKEIFESDTIVKSGAELWGDSLDIYRDLGIAMNNGCNMTKSFTTTLSLEIMTNLALCGEAMQTGLVWAFKKDKVSTTSNWDADHLSIRQLVYAALDAQTSYFIGKNLSRPPPFNLQRMSQPWLQQAGSWLLMSKYMESAQEKELRASFEDMVYSDTGLSVLMNQYNKRIRLGSDVTVHLTDGTKVACLVTGVNGKRADLQWENVEDVLGKEDVDIERITLTRKFEDTLLPKPVKDYLASVMHDESENHPIVNALLSYFYDGPDIVDPSLVTHDLSVGSSTLHSLSAIHQAQHTLPAELLQQEWINELNESQQYAVALALHNYITTIQGPPGSGKCWANGTKLMLYDGSCQRVECIKPGDLLMGDDSTPRLVQPGSLITGRSQLYEICSSNPGRAPWRCNADHILVLQFNSPPTPIQFDRDLNAWSFSQFTIDGDRVILQPYSYLTQVEAERAQADAVNHFKPLVWECTVLQFLACSSLIQQSATMFQPKLVQFPSPSIPLQTHLEQIWSRTASSTEVHSIAWLLGFTFSHCLDFSDSSKRMEFNSTFASPINIDSTLQQLLVMYPPRSTTIPHQLLQESIEIRSHLLAGLIDGCGHYLDAIDAYQLASIPQQDVESILHLARSLGFVAIHLDGSIQIGGEGLHLLPTLAQCKPIHSASSSSSFSRFAGFTIKPVGVGDWHGFTLDGNGRLLMSDFVVTHNTSTIAAIVRTLICDPNCKILCVARTNTAARHMASACAKFIGPHKLTLQVSQEFFKEWHEDQYTELLDGGYVPGMTGTYDGYYRDHQVLVMTTGICFTKPELTQGRTVVILDEGSQIWDLEAILFLRAMDCLDKLILFGDSKQLSCYVAPEWRVSANSILDLANLAATRARLFPDHWQQTGLLEVKQCMLNVQYRMVKHLGDMISSLFYDGVLRSADGSTVRAVSWHDVRGFSQADEQFSVYNLAEVDEVIRLWRHLCSHGYRADEIVIISMYEAQRQKLSETGVISNARIYNVDSFQGQESPIVILVLANNMLTEFLKDTRRINVACSRAQQRLYIVGDLSTFSKPEAGVWSKIAAYAASEYKPAMEMPDMEVDFPTLGTVAPSPSVRPTSSWASATKPSIKGTIKPNPNKLNAQNPPTTPIATTNKPPPSFSAAANGTQSNGLTTPSKPHSTAISQTNLLGRLTAAATGSPILTSVASPSFAAMASPSGGSTVSTPKLTARAAPFVPSKSAAEFVPGGSTSKPLATVTNHAPTIPFSYASKLELASNITSSPKIVPNMAPTPNHPGSRDRTPTYTSSTPAMDLPATAFSSIGAAAMTGKVGAAATLVPPDSILTADSFPAISNTPIKMPISSSPYAKLNFAAKVAATTSTLPSTTIPPVTTHTQPTITHSNATPVKPTTSKSTMATPIKSSTPPFIPAATPDTTVKSSPVGPSSTNKWGATIGTNKKSSSDPNWTCPACSFHNTTAERYCEVCQTARK